MITSAAIHAVCRAGAHERGETAQLAEIGSADIGLLIADDLMQNPP
jgi:hypothetical protein